jgi:hypothetical protein
MDGGSANAKILASRTSRSPALPVRHQESATTPPVPSARIVVTSSRASRERLRRCSLVASLLSNAQPIAGRPPEPAFRRKFPRAARQQQWHRTRARGPVVGARITTAPNHAEEPKLPRSSTRSLRLTRNVAATIWRSVRAGADATPGCHASRRARRDEYRCISWRGRAVLQLRLRAAPGFRSPPLKISEVPKNPA